MKTKNSILVLSLFLLSFSQVSAQQQSDKKVDWNGYMQLRGTTNFDDSWDAAVRRLKFWIHSSPAFSKHWSFKVQAVYISHLKQKILIQDVFGQYQTGNGNHALRFGQFTPKYSLQWTQPDYRIPTVERARAINTLVPDGTMGVRDLGIQYTVKMLEKKLQMSFGVFKGRGIVEYDFKKSGFLLTQNSSYKFNINNAALKLGYSVMYRQTEDFQVLGVLPDTTLFTGDDFRFALYGIVQTQHFDFQAEYLRGWLNGMITFGYYGLATLKLNPENKIFLSYDYYQDLIDSTTTNPWYFAGYNYLFNDYKLMLTFETGFRQNSGRWQNLTVLQIQVFFN